MLYEVITHLNSSGHFARSQYNLIHGADDELGEMVVRHALRLQADLEEVMPAHSRSRQRWTRVPRVRGEGSSSTGTRSCAARRCVAAARNGQRA